MKPIVNDTNETHNSYQTRSKRKYVCILKSDELSCSQKQKKNTLSNEKTNSAKNLSNSLEYIEQKCKEYIDDPLCVYKMCQTKKGQWLVIMRKLPETTTNEIRNNVFDIKYAKFRANKLKVVVIINVNNGNVIKSIDNTYYGHHFFKSRITYTVGDIVTPDKFDNNLDNVCSHGIHYLKTIKAAFFYRKLKKYSGQKYSGQWMKFYDDGAVMCEGLYINGKKEGDWVYFNNDGSIKCKENYVNGVQKDEKKICKYENGNIKSEGKYVNGKEEGEWTEYYENGIIENKGKYVKGKKNGEWTEYYKNGNISQKGNYIKGKKDGEWYLYNIYGRYELKESYIDGFRCRTEYPVF